jgi:hypothetical protein
MGREGLDKDFIVWSNIANTMSTRHELAHRGFKRLEDKGVIFSDTEEHAVIKLFDFMLGDDNNKAQVHLYFNRQDPPMTIEEAFKEYKPLMQKALKESFKELGGVPIPEPFGTK